MRLRLKEVDKELCLVLPRSLVEEYALFDDEPLDFDLEGDYLVVYLGD